MFAEAERKGKEIIGLATSNFAGNWDGTPTKIRSQPEALFSWENWVGTPTEIRLNDQKFCFSKPQKN